jgi:hypothetical protein
MRLMIDAYGGSLCGLVLCRLETGKLVYVHSDDPDYEIQYPEGPATFPRKKIERFLRADDDSGWDNEIEQRGCQISDHR